MTMVHRSSHYSLMSSKQSMDSSIPHQARIISYGLSYNPNPSNWKDTIRADHGKTDTYYPTNFHTITQSKKLISKDTFDKRNGSRELPKLPPGDWVRAKLDNEKSGLRKLRSLVKTKVPGHTS